MRSRRRWPHSRIERELVLRALNKPAEVQEYDFAEERRAVERAEEEALQLRIARETAAATQEQIDAAVAKERERCARLCEQFPDNLVAKYIGEKIRRGE